MKNHRTPFPPAKLLVFVISLITLSASAQNVGVNTDTPDSTLSIANKVEIGGTQGDVVFTDDFASIMFPNTTLPNSPMIYMFQSLGNNDDRMVLAHTPNKQDWGLQYKDKDDQFHFIAGGKHAMSIDLNTNEAYMALADATLNDDYTLNIESARALKSVNVVTDNDEPMAPTFGLDVMNRSSGYFLKHGGRFRSTGPGGTNVGLEAIASGGADGNTAFIAWSEAGGIAADFAQGLVRVQDTMAIGDTKANGYRLSVDGKIMAEELRIEISGQWPDYVFEESYELISLEQLEVSIQDNGHLPGIPSADKIATEGVMVGDMQKRMMEKIEELTLYVIELNKKNTELEAKVKMLECNLNE